MSQNNLKMIDNPTLGARADKYDVIEVDLDKIIEGWRISLFSFEWLTAEGHLRPPAQLPDKEREKYEAVLSQYQAGEDLPRPILGIGVMDNIEIGGRRDVLLTLYSQGVKRLPVHVPKSNIKDFKPYL